MEESYNLASYSLLASGYSANFELEVWEYYEAHPGIYWLNFVWEPKSHSRIELSFTLTGLNVLEQALAYLQEGCLERECQGSLILGQCFGRAVTLAQDDEWLQRYYILVQDDNFPGDVLCFTVAGDRMKQLVAVLKEIIEELKS